MNGPLASASESFQQSQIPAESAGSQAQESGNAGSADFDSAAHDQKAMEQLMDLDGVEKFRFQGQDWTPEELHKAIMRQDNYTKKTTEIAQERKWYENLHYDLAEVKRNPRLADEFKKIYPEKFHNYLDVVLEQSEAQAQVPAQKDGDRSNLPPEVLQRLEALENTHHESKVTAIEQQLDQLFGNLSKKYDFAVEESVMTKAEALIAKGYKMNEATWDRLFKQSHEANQAKAQKWYDSKVKSQLQKNQEGGDIGRGGGTPGAGQKRMNLSQATEAMIASLSKNN